MKSLFRDNCHKHVRHFLSVGAFWDRKIHRIGIHGNGGRRNTGHRGWLVNWKPMAPEHWKRRTLELMLVDVDGWSIITARRSSSLSSLLSTSCGREDVASPTWTSPPNKAEHGERFIPERWTEFSGTAQTWHCNPVMRVVISKPGHQHLVYVTICGWRGLPRTITKPHH